MSLTILFHFLCKFTLTLNHPSLQNKTTDVVIQQHSRKLLMMDILMSETCWAQKKWNKIASDIKLVFHSSAITMAHGPINVSNKRRFILIRNYCFCWHHVLGSFQPLIKWSSNWNVGNYVLDSFEYRLPIACNQGKKNSEECYTIRTFENVRIAKKISGPTY